MVVTDDFPAYIVRDHNSRVPSKIGIPYYVVDSSCIVPMSCFPKQEYAAYTLRPKISRLLDEHLHPVEMEPVKHPWPGKRTKVAVAKSTNGGALRL